MLLLHMHFWFIPGVNVRYALLPTAPQTLLTLALTLTLTINPNSNLRTLTFIDFYYGVMGFAILLLGCVAAVDR